MKPRLRFAHLPTPVEAMPRLTTALNGPQLWVKRDDQTGLAFGGNKTRKLEYLLAAAQAEDAKTLISAGAVQSNHCRQTVAAAAKFGFDCILVLFGDPPDPPDGNHLLHYLLGAQIVFTEREQVQEKAGRSLRRGAIRRAQALSDPLRRVQSYRRDGLRQRHAGTG